MRVLLWTTCLLVLSVAVVSWAKDADDVDLDEEAIMESIIDDEAPDEAPEEPQAPRERVSHDITLKSLILDAP